MLQYFIVLESRLITISAEQQNPKYLPPINTFNYLQSAYKVLYVYKTMQMVPHHRLLGTVSWNLLIKVNAINYRHRNQNGWHSTEFGGSIKRLDVEHSWCRLSVGDNDAKKN